MLHVRVRAPRAPGQPMRLQPYSAHLDETSQSFTLIVKVYSGGPPEFAGVSGYLGSVEVGDFVHVPEIRQLDWRRDSKRTGMVCLGVGITECLGPAEVLLKAGAEVRMVYGNRNAGQIILRDQTARLLQEYPDRFRLRHALSQPSDDAKAALDAGSKKSQPGERMTAGRVDYKVLKQEFGGTWEDGKVVQHFFMIGTSDMERSILGMIGRAQLADFSKIRGHPKFLLMKGPHGDNGDWSRLSPLETSSNAKQTKSTTGPVHDEV